MYVFNKIASRVIMGALEKILTQKLLADCNKMRIFKNEEFFNVFFYNRIQAQKIRFINPYNLGSGYWMLKSDCFFL